MPSAEAAARERATVLEARNRVALMKTPSQPGTNVITERSQVGIAFTSVPARAGGWVPAGINALRPDDINTIDVSKHAAGTVAPNAVSIVTITLKPGAPVPTSTNR